ncbi:hypothetical protein BU23DRAFT_595631 [Bimuria novae-zelandiae CBS 107.79]|uniref:Uncharacterized protein n=1 Tax=Bimuria novae-zelandiae CBS 107.79 TaxID=1447943 RepID=A0A6A5VPF6_9PLEO|nr:hypothetical protein BU23DRAFT_595631 [Bimuria novae-zelandiae CBS 107.79]
MTQQQPSHPRDHGTYRHPRGAPVDEPISSDFGRNDPRMAGRRSNTGSQATRAQNRAEISLRTASYASSTPSESNKWAATDQRYANPPKYQAYSLGNNIKHKLLGKKDESSAVEAQQPASGTASPAPNGPRGYDRWLPTSESYIRPHADVYQHPGYSLNENIKHMFRSLASYLKHEKKNDNNKDNAKNKDEK